MAYNSEWMDGEQFAKMLECRCDVRDGHPCASPACIQLGLASTAERFRLTPSRSPRRTSFVCNVNPYSPDVALLASTISGPSAATNISSDASCEECMHI